MKLPLIVLFLLFQSLSIHAQVNYPPPSGVWCSCPPSTGNGVGSVLPQVAEKDFVKGILVRAVWKDIEPEDNIFNWDIIDEQIEAANLYGKKISLGVGSGPNSPDWLYTMGAASITYDIPFEGTIPVPWDGIFLGQWTDFVKELGDRYQNDTTIQLVYITNSSTNGFEMQIPFQPTPDYPSLGYSDQKMIDSWKTVVNTFKEAFPNHYLTNDFHPVNASDLVADSIYTYAQTQIGERYGASAWWWTQHNTTVYPAQYSLLQHSASNNLFSGLQMAASGTDNPDTFGSGGMPEALSLAISQNMCYWEIWNNDILNEDFESLLENASCSTVTSTVQSIPNPEILIFPNPASNYFHIKTSQESIPKSLQLYNSTGQLVQSAKRQTTLNVSGLPNGFYFLKIELISQVIVRTVLIVR
ncbi:MAG: T9SS type A sorting domain-containing protein [Bacteroidetes bacterium]|nr:T9SS type A sorting domain-containing protein [Bacteroidota bacterium]